MSQLLVLVPHPVYQHSADFYQVSYFTPKQDPPAGTAVSPDEGNPNLPKLFAPLRIRGLELHNRILVRPFSMADF